MSLSRPTPPYAAILERLLTFCAPLRNERPWQFLPADDRCYGPVGDPGAALAALRREYPDEMLVEAGVVERPPSGGWRLAPALGNPAGALIALAGADGRVYEILTARGCLTSRTLPVLAVLEDARTLALAASSEQLFATPRIREVAVLRSLGLAATLSLGLDRIDNLAQLRALRAAFVPTPRKEDWLPPLTEEEDRAPDGASSGGDPAGPAAEPVAEPAAGPAAEPVAEPAAEPAPPESLVLLGWDPLHGTARLPACVPRIAAALRTARQYLRLSFDTFQVWRLTPRDLDTLAFRLRYADRELVLDAVHATLGRLNPLSDFADPTQIPPPGPRPPPPLPANAAAGHRELLTALGKSHWGEMRPGEFVGRAWRNYNQLVERDLVEPLATWALAHRDPVDRNVGTELAHVAALLHEFSPRLRHGGVPIAPEDLTQYLVLSRRFEFLLKSLQERRGPR